MAMRVLSVEIGQGLTHVVEMDYLAKNPKVYNCFSFKTPDGVLSDGTVARSNAFTNALNMEKNKRNIKTTKIVYSVTSSRIANRDVAIPMCKDKEIQSIIDANANDYFPVDMSQYHLVYRKLGTEKTEEGGEQIKLSLLAVPNEITKSYFNFSDSIRHTVRGIDYIGNSIFEATRRSFGSGVNVVVKIDTSSSLVTIIDNGNVALQRNVSYGMALAADVVQEYMEKEIEEAYEGIEDLEEEKEEVTYMDAVDALCNKPFIAPTFASANDTLSEEEADKDVIALRGEVTNTFRYLVGNISRIMDYYTSRHDNVEIEGITVIGIGADLVGMTDLLSNELEMEVNPLTEIKGVTFLQKNKNIKLGEYAAAIGAGIKTWNIIPAGMGMQKDLKESLVVPFVVAVACVVAAGGMYIFGQVNYSMQVNARDKKLEQKNALADAQVKQDEYDQAVADLNTVEGISNSATNTNSNLPDFIGEFEMKMPKEITVTNITSDISKVTVTCTVQTKEAAATVINNLREFEMITAVTSSGFTENDEGISFTVTCIYAPIVQTEESK